MRPILLLQASECTPCTVRYRVLRQGTDVCINFVSPPEVAELLENMVVPLTKTSASEAYMAPAGNSKRLDRHVIRGKEV